MASDASPFPADHPFAFSGVGAVSRRGEATVVFLSGELDITTADQVEAALAAALADAAEREASRVEADLSGVTLLDSTGVSLLVAARRTAVASQRTFVITAASEQVARLLTLTRLDQVFGYQR
jgi:anti-sigma B factor antagonist